MNETIARALRRWQTWVWAALAALALYIAYLLISGLLTPQVPSEPSENQMVMHGIVSQGKHGKNGWKFVADSSEISPDGYTTTYHNVRDATFFRDGKPTYQLKAAVVTVDSRNQNYAASGGVHVWSTAQTMPDDLQTREAYWNQTGQTLTCPTPTRLVYNGTIMHTSNMTANLQTGASQLGDTSIDYRKTNSPAPPAPVGPTPTVSAGPIPPTASPAPRRRD